MSATIKERRELKGLGSSIEHETQFVRDYLEPIGYKQVKPENIGALTAATLIQDKDGDVWGDMDYAVRSFIEELQKGNEVFWRKG